MEKGAWLHPVCQPLGAEAGGLVTGVGGSRLGDRGGSWLSPRGTGLQEEDAEVKGVKS